MTQAEFREKHSELIEYYQYIEMRLKGICAVILADENRDWFERLNDYESDPLGKLIKQIKTLQTQKQMVLFSPEDFKHLRACGKRAITGSTSVFPVTLRCYSAKEM